MSWGPFGARDGIDRTLRRAYGEPSRSFVEQLARTVPARRGVRVGRPALLFAAAFSAASLAALAAVGGIGSAAGFAGEVVHHSTLSRVLSGGAKLLVPQQHSAATDEYGGVPVSGNSSSEAVPKDTSGSVSATPPNAPGPVTVLYSPGVFTEDVTLTVDPTPPDSVVGSLAGGANQVVSIVVTDASGKKVTHLGAPLEIVFTLPESTSLTAYAPTVSLDGVTYASIAPCVGLRALGPNQPECFYADGRDIHVLTTHLTIFGVVAKSNLTISESGRPFAAAGSGKFGDPELVHTGAAVLRHPGRVEVFPLRKPNGTAVRFSFFVDEQAGAWISVRKGTKSLPIVLRGTMLRGSTLKRSGAVRTLHFAVLKPGTLPLRLRLRAGAIRHGVRYRVRVAVIDFDGHRTVEFVPFTG